MMARLPSFMLHTASRTLPVMYLREVACTTTNVCRHITPLLRPLRTLLKAQMTRFGLSIFLDCVGTNLAKQLLAQPLIQTHSQQEQEGTQPTELTRQDSVAESDSSSKFSASRPVLGSVDSSIPRHADDSNVQIVNVEGGLMPEEFSQPHEEISGEALKLRSALSECWTLCNTLESLSSTSRHRIFSQTARGTLQELAWNNCWKLCKDLYEYRDEPLLNMHQTIELCRDFARARFDARSRAHGAEDAMLRVSFEMNSHLYNIRDTTLPPTFTKRTMDFYVAFCHRMMKQRTVFPQETDALLRAGWWLAEALYMLQQSSIDGSNNDEELIAAAIQACWELSDLFRDGWSQRTERSTPRANQTRFPTRTRAALTTSEGRTSSLSNRTYHDATSSFPSQEPPLPPETPVTIFDDIVGSESPEANNVPNILVLGPDNSVSRPLRGQDSHHDRWSSNASSTASGHSGRVQPSQRTSSSIRNSEERYHLHMLRAMLLKAAVKHGFDPRASTSLTDGALQDFVVSLPDDVFGNGVHEVQLFQHYRSLITKDRPLRNVGRLLGKTFPAGHVAQAVRWLIDRSRSEWSWMSPLYEYVMGSRLTDMGEDRLASSLEF